MNKLTKITLATAFGAGLLPVCMSANAAAMPAPTNHFEGFYLGAGAGIVNLDSKITQYLGDDSKENEYFSHESGSHDGAGNIFAGYGQIYHPFYLGVELFSRYTPSDVDTFLKRDLDSGTETHTAHLKTKYSYGGTIRGGYQAMAYVLLGVDSAKFRATSYNGNHEVESKVSKTKTGITPGFGIEVFTPNISNQISIRTQYTYSHYSEFENNWAADSLENYFETIDPARSLWTIDFTYHVS